MSGALFDKTTIARNFSAAAAGYDTSATAQAKIALTLTQRLPEDFTPTRMVDLGCGTGLLSARLLDRYPAASLLGLDLATGMVESCRRRWAGLDRARFVTGDAEAPTQLVPCTDLVACSCAAQWFGNPADALRRWAAALTPGGLLACAFLIDGSFAELALAYRQTLQTTFRGLSLWNTEKGPAIAVEAGLKMLHRDEESIVTTYESAHAALRSFQQIGAFFKGQPGHMPLGPGQTRRLLAVYDRLAEAPGRVPVTHRVQYVIAEKPR